jgi:hypothetical protein
MLMLLTFLTRHFFAFIVSVVVPIIIVVITHLLLLAVAIVTGGGLGSPIALPGWSLIVSAIAAGYTIFLLFPSVCLAELITCKFSTYRHLLQIPISMIILAVLVFLFAIFPVRVSRLWPPESIKIVFIVFLLLLLPLGLYCWSMKFAQAALFIPAWLFKKAKSLLAPAATN